MSIDMSQFYQVFFDESAEHLAAMEGLLLDLDIENPDSEHLNAIFRAAHSIKGSAGTFGFSDLSETTHILENLLDRIRKGELILRAEMVDAFLECGDCLRDMLEAHQGRGEVDRAVVEAICTRLRELSTDMPSTADASAAISSGALGSARVFDIQFVPSAVSIQNGGVNNLLAELRTLGSLEILSQPDSPEGGVGFWRMLLTSDIGQEAFADQIDFVADNAAWSVIERASGSVNDTEEEAYGFFDDQPADANSVAAADDAYGFFDPLPGVKQAPLPTAEEDSAYGFFEPLITVQAEAIAPSAVEGDGYGFFVAPEVPQSQAPQIPPKVEEAVQAVEVKSPPVSDKLPEARKRSGKTNAPASSGGDSSIRVSVEKVDQLINLVGELVITQAMLMQTANQMMDGAPERLLNGLSQLERNTRDLQESVMSIRMLPISFVFSRFPRVVRDLSAKLGKQVDLKTSGETTELDKGLIERIADPLTHLIRNSLDHGIELPEKRIAAGKDPVGSITLKAYHQGGNIVIEVGDDGAGLHRAKILAKARERGLQVSDQMTDQEVFHLIFEAGFSTAEQVTDVSGRGVGMDVVRRNIQSMGGRVEIDSMAGVGTRMTVRLPLTLAILDGMSVAVGNQTYILPLSYVIESFQPQSGDIKTLSNQGKVVQVRGDYLPVVVLHELFGVASHAADLTEGIMVVIDADGIKAALFVDGLLGQHQVVIKSLEANYRRVPGISGATIMGDGHVALILDVSVIAGTTKNIMQKPPVGGNGG